jgi:hypothetical protein
MIFITGADRRFLQYGIIQEWENCMNKFFCQYEIYDLGGLTFGKKGFEVTDLNFKMHGYYNQDAGYKTTALHKPIIILDALNSNIDNIVYLDADAFLKKRINPNFDEFDIGVVEREFEDTKHNVDNILSSVKILRKGLYNAGVLFFSNNQKVKGFVKEWIDKTQEVGNDQAALSLLLKEKDLRIKVYDSIYNTRIDNNETYIYHETGGRKNGKSIR